MEEKDKNGPEKSGPQDGLQEKRKDGRRNADGGGKTDGQKGNDLQNVPANLFVTLSAIATLIGVVFYGLTFTPLGVLSLCIATVFSLAALSLLNYQKKRGIVKFYRAALVAAYILFALCLLTFAGGIVYAALYAGQG